VSASYYSKSVIIYFLHLRLNATNVQKGTNLLGFRTPRPCNEFIPPRLTPRAIRHPTEGDGRFLANAQAHQRQRKLLLNGDFCVGRLFKWMSVVGSRQAECRLGTTPLLHWRLRSESASFSP
jgi:hypothetical protein